MKRFIQFSFILLVFFHVDRLKAESLAFIPHEVYFSYRSHTIPDASVPNLLKLVSYLNQNPEVKIVISGYAKDGLTNKGDIDLSTRRADSMKRFLLVHGIHEKRIISYGLGRSNSKTEQLDDKSAQKFHRKVVIGLE
ncbi:MAG: OmpA family protein [Leptospira sp.]|nr:OmpA family protein [Leptospira sp.]